MKKEAFEIESLAFAARVKIFGNYDQDRWFKGAYSALNARFTVKGGRISRESKESLKELLFSSIENLKSFSPDDYDKWFFELAQKITDSEPELSFGHTQKLINILMKYHFVYFYSNFDEEWKKKHLWMLPYFTHFHAPVDRKVLQEITEKYSMRIPFNKFSWTKWQWIDKALYERIQDFIQKVADKNELYYKNRLYFEMKELWKASSKKKQEKKYDSRRYVKVNGGNSLRSLLEEVIIEINKESDRTFELNETDGYFSIALSGAIRNKNVVCFVKNEPVISINKNVNIKKSILDSPPYNKLKRRPRPPPPLQLRHGDEGRYPHNLEYNLEEDKNIILQLCKTACKSFRR